MWRWRSSGIGLVLICAGILYLLVQTHVLDFVISGAVIWSIVLIVAGILSVTGSRRKFSIWGLYMIVLGALYLAKYAAHVSLLASVNDWALLFGLAVIFAGIEMLTPKRWRKHIRVELTSDPITGKARRIERHRADRRLIGDISIGQQPWVLKDLNLWNGIGDVRVNLGTARYEEGTYKIDVGGWIGDIRILVPDTLPVRVIAVLGVGDITLFDDNHSGMKREVMYEDPQFADAPTKVILTVELKIGDVEIVRV